MASELDPLLPRNQPAPEISGYVFSKPNPVEVRYGDAAPHSFRGDEPYPEHADNDDDSGSASTQSTLYSICIIFISVVLLAFVTSITLQGGLDGNWGGSQPAPAPVPGRPSLTIAERVDEILKTTPLIDGHDDLAILLRSAYRNEIHTARFRTGFEQGGLKGHVDLPRLKKGKVGGTFWSAFVPCPANASYDFSDHVYGASVSATLAQIDLLRRLQADYPATFTPAPWSATNALFRFRENRSLISPISIEGLHQIPPSSPFSTLRLYYHLGVRAASLTWNCHNAFADAALIPHNETGTMIAAPPQRGGLTAAGRRLITEMNRLGMLVDLSHTSYWTQKAVLTNQTSRAPVIFSHSSAFALCPHPRNVRDEILDRLQATDSLIMINFTPEFISCLPPPDSSLLPEPYWQNNTLRQIGRHVVYVGERIGYDHVGLGSDFNAMAMTPEGMEGVDRFPDLVAELLRMGVSDEEAGKVVGGNILRVWRAAEEVGRKMREDGVLEMEDEVLGWNAGGFMRGEVR